MSDAETSGAGPSGTVAIGEVIDRLEDEFPDLTISKLRFLESEGLVQPARSAAGYRRYSEDDVARLTWVLRQQRDHFLPLKVIGEMIEAGRADDGDGGSDDGTVHAFREQVASGSLGSLSVSRAELAYMVGLDDDQIAELERVDLVRGRPAGRSTVYDDEAVLVARVAGCLLAHGLDVRHLRGHLVAAQREAGILAQVVPAVAGGGRPSAEPRRLVAELVDAGTALYELLLRRELGDLGR